MKTTNILFSLLLAAWGASVFAGDLSPIEQKREFLVDATLTLDALQTMDIKNHPELHETNPLLGNHPGDVKIFAYFVGAGVGHYAVTKALPTEYRAAWQYGWAALEIATIIRNHRLDLRFNF
jgi:hypothetical protein